MGFDIKYSDIKLVADSINKQISAWDTELTDISKSINNICNMTSFSGATANSAKAYFGEVHMMIIANIKNVLSYMKYSLLLYSQSYYTKVDSNDNAKFNEDAFQELKNSYTYHANCLQWNNDELRSKLNQISDIVYIPTPSIDYTCEIMSNINMQVTQLSEKIYTQENYAIETLIPPIKEYIASLMMIIDDCTTKSGFSGYHKGDINNFKGYQEINENSKAYNDFYVNNKNVIVEALKNNQDIEELYKIVDMQSVSKAFGFTDEQCQLIKKAFYVIQADYDGDTNSTEYLNYVFSILAPLCISYDSRRFRLTTNDMTSEDAQKELKKLGLSEQEVTDLAVMINMQHLQFKSNDFKQIGIDFETSTYKNITHDDYVNNIDINKDFAHELIQYAGFSNSIPEGYNAGINDFFNGKLGRAAVDLFNSNFAYSYTNYEISFKGDIDSTRWDTGDFASDVDAINTYARMLNGDSPLIAITDYNNEIYSGVTNRSKEFFTNLGDGQEDIGILELQKILDADTYGSEFINGAYDKSKIDNGKQAFVQWLFSQYDN